jgi:hypothetical protein
MMSEVFSLLEVRERPDSADAAMRPGKSRGRDEKLHPHCTELLSRLVV